MKKLLLILILFLLSANSAYAAIRLKDYSTLYNDAGLINYWLLDGNSTADIGAVSGTDTNMSYTASSQTGFGQSATFGATSDIALAAKIPAAAEFSINVWLKTTASTDSTLVDNISCSSGGNPWGFCFEMLADGTIEFATRAGTVWAVFPVTTGTVNNGAWRMVTVTYLNSTDANSAKIYIDGTLDKQATPTATISSAYTNNTRIGRNSTADTAHFVGDLDDVFFFNRVLTATEITNYYNTSPPPAAGGNVSDEMIIFE